MVVMQLNAAHRVNRPRIKKIDPTTSPSSGRPGTASIGAPLMNVQFVKQLGTATILIGLISLLTSCKTAGSQSQAAWRPIFDGKNTEGWKMTGPGELKLENGELVTYGGMGL